MINTVSRFFLPSIDPVRQSRPHSNFSFGMRGDRHVSRGMEDMTSGADGAWLLKPCFWRSLSTFECVWQFLLEPGKHSTTTLASQEEHSTIPAQTAPFGLRHGSTRQKCPAVVERWSRSIASATRRPQSRRKLLSETEETHRTSLIQRGAKVSSVLENHITHNTLP